MGINGLLQYFKSVEKDVTVGQYSGKTLAIDGHSWIHKAIYGFGYSIVMKNDYSKMLKSILARIDVLTYYKIKIVFVVDGGHLPIKLTEEGNRETNRQMALMRGHEAMDNGS
jgi:exonuclease-1